MIKRTIVVDPLELGVLKSFDIEKRKELLEDVLFIPRDKYDVYFFIPVSFFSIMLSMFIFRRSGLFFDDYFDSMVLLELAGFLYFLLLMLVSYTLFINIVLRVTLFLRVTYLKRVNRR